VLFYNPNLPRVRLQLGQLYFKLGAYQMARSYFEQAAAGGAPADVQSQANQFIAEIDRRLSPHRWGFFGHTGLRHQTNASAGPNGLVIRASGLDVALNNQFARQPDWNWFGMFGAYYAYDPQWTNGMLLEAGVLGYYAKQFRLHQFDLGLIELQTGPRFPLPLAGVTWKPYVIAAATSLDSSLYYSGLGVGVSTRFFVGDFTRFEPYVEYRRRDFNSPAAFPTSFQQSGALLTAAVAGEGAIFGPVRWIGRAGFEKYEVSNSDFNFNAYERWYVEAGFPIAFPWPWFGNGDLIVTPLVGINGTGFGGINALVDPVVVRKDRGWQAGVLIDMPVYQNIGFRTQILHTETISNLPNFDMNNLSVIFGPTLRY
jgi:hypothetical protein